MSEETIRLGVIGCGGFGLFALQHFAQVPGVQLAGMAGTHREAARAAAKRFGIPDIQEVEALVRRPDIDLVYIATPPFLHHPQALLALPVPRSQPNSSSSETSFMSASRSLSSSEYVEETAGTAVSPLIEAGSASSETRATLSSTVVEISGGQ